MTRAKRARVTPPVDLPISVAFLEMHDADIDVSSRAGEGTEVTIIFPVMRSAWQQATTTQ